MRKIMLLIFIILCTGCIKNPTKTTIEVNNNYVISINYPLTNIKKVDKKIKNFVDEAYRSFKKNNSNYELELSELNIDGNFDFINHRYITVYLETLKEYDACATFFVLGNKVKYYQSTLLKLLDYGNEIGNHTYNHKLLSKLTDEEILAQIEKTQEIIKEYNTPTLFRPSYGTLKNRQKEKIGLDIVLWNIDKLDWKYKSSKTIAKRALSKARDWSIILMHDTYKRNIDALKTILELKKQKYQFVTVSELLEVRMLRNLNE